MSRSRKCQEHLQTEERMCAEAIEWKRETGEDTKQDKVLLELMSEREHSSERPGSEVGARSLR